MRSFWTSPPTIWIWKASPALSNGLQAYPGNLFFASHDHQFIDEIANRIIEFPLGKEGCLDYAGGFEEYLEWKRSRA